MSLRVRELATGEVTDWQGECEHLWLDLEAPTEAELGRLKAAFRLNPIALEDALEQGHWSRFARYPEHFYLIFRTLSDSDELKDIVETSDEVDIFWFAATDVLITVRNREVPYLEQVWHQDFIRLPELASLDVLYNLLQAGTETFFAFSDRLEAYTASFEQKVLRGEISERRHVYSEFLKLRHAVTLARKLSLNAYEHCNQFARHASDVSEQTSFYLRDVSDHLFRVQDEIDTVREMVSSLLEVYFSAQNTIMNETMRTLTTVSTVFLPLTFLAGVWGMNFHHMPELSWRLGYVFAWSSFAATGALLLWYFKRRGWW